MFEYLLMIIKYNIMQHTQKLDQDLIEFLATAFPNLTSGLHLRAVWLQSVY